VGLGLAGIATVSAALVLAAPVSARLRHPAVAPAD
jgi:hypothetical protein